MIFSVDEKQVIYSNIYTNDIVFFDYKGERKLNIIKGKLTALQSLYNTTCYNTDLIEHCHVVVPQMF